MDALIIFGAKYLFILSPLICLYLFYKASDEVRREILIFAGITLPIAFILSVIARNLYFNPRPFVVGEFIPLISHTPDNGFPSDHILLLASLAMVGVRFFSYKFMISLWGITLIVGITRILAGVHHSIDIMGSILIAILSGEVAYAIIHKLWNKNQTN